MSSPVAGAKPGPLPVFNFTGRSDDWGAPPAVPDRRFEVAGRRSLGGGAASSGGGGGSSAPDSARAVRLDISALDGAHPLVRSLSRNASISNLVLSDGAGSSRGGSPTPRTGSAAPSPPGSSRLSTVSGGGGGAEEGASVAAAAATAAEAVAAKLADVLSHAPDHVGKLELDMRHTEPHWSARLPEVLGCLDRTLTALALRLPWLSPEGAESVSELLSSPFCVLAELEVTASPAHPLTGDVVMGLAEGLRSNARLRCLRLEPVAPADVDAAVAAVRAAVVTGGAHHLSPALTLPPPALAGGDGSGDEDALQLQHQQQLRAKPSVLLVINGVEHHI
jgi:hypothetical protein